MMKIYKCKKELWMDLYDGNGFLIEENGKVVEVGEVYETCEDYGLMVACKPAIHLVRVHENIWSWIEIYPEMLEEYFEEITDKGCEEK